MKGRGMVVLLALCLSVSAFADNPHHDRDLIYGKITSINSVDMQIVVDGVTVQVTSNTVIMKFMVPITFDDLAVGMTVHVMGEYSGKIFMAFMINVVRDCNHGYGQVQGAITSIDLVKKQIVVDDVIVQATPETVITKHMHTFKFEDLKVGMYVCAQGQYKQGILVADHISVMDGHGR